MNGGLKNLSLLWTAVSTWSMSTRGTGWQIAVQLENMEVDKSYIVLSSCSSQTDHTKFNLVFAESL